MYAHMCVCVCAQVSLLELLAHQLSLTSKEVNALVKTVPSFRGFLLSSKAFLILPLYFLVQFFGRRTDYLFPWCPPLPPVFLTRALFLE